MTYERVPKENIEHIEVRFVRYLPPPKNSNAKDDYHLVKEVIHTKDKRQVPNVRFIKNYKRDYYITKPGFRNHQQKKEWELLERLQRYTCREYELDSSIALSLDTILPHGGLRRLFRNPYIYGADVTSTTLLKQRYMDQYKGDPTHFSVAVFDTETDMVHGHKEIVMATISFGSKVYTAVTKAYLEGESDAVKRTKELFDEHLKEHIEARKIEWEFEVVDHAMDILFNCFGRAHQWQPDWVEVWNIDFDVPKMLEMCSRYHVNPEDIFCDPRVPKPYRYFNYRKGAIQRKTASGLVVPIKPAAQWHTVDVPASFQFIDGMQAYKHIRTGQAELQSYSMDYVMNLELNLGKLRFEKGSHVREGSADWHIYMQRHAKLEYIIYNVFDCIGLELLDEKTKDLSLALPTHSGSGDLSYFNSQPRRKATELHFFLLNLKEPNKPRVIGTTSDQMRDEIDDLTYDLSGWINHKKVPLCGNTKVKKTLN